MIPRRTNSHQTSDMFHMTERYENAELEPSLSFVGVNYDCDCNYSCNCDVKRLVKMLIV